MEKYENLLNWNFLGNNGQEYLLATVVFVGVTVAFKIFQFLIIKKIEKVSKKTETDIDDFLIGLVKNIKSPLYFLISIYVASHFLNIQKTVSLIFDRVIIVVIAIQITLILQQVIDYIAGKIIKKTIDPDAESGNIEEEAVIRLISRVAKFILWVIAILLLLANLGVNVTSAVAGLGIGGIAIAMAVKDLLSDIISAISIYIDKPFRVGQRIQVGKDAGVVEHIGIKTTRLRTSQGEELIIANQELGKARVQNFKRMDTRRGQFVLGMVYGISAEKLERIPKLIEEIINNTDGSDFDRCHFSAYGDFSLNFETTFHSQSADYGDFLDIQQKIYLEIYKKFEEEKIEFAFPTQTIFVEKTKQD